MVYKRKNRHKPNEFVQIVKNMNNRKNKGYKKNLNLTLKKGTQKKM
jgi:hypothetical protein